MEVINEEVDSSPQSNDQAQSVHAIAVTCRSLFRAVVNGDCAVTENAIQNRIPLLFQQRADQRPINTLDDLRDDFESLRVWANNLGVFATDNSSLDFRLREAPEVRDDLVSLLGSIATDLHECHFLLEKDRSFESNDDSSESSSESEDDGDSELQLPAPTKMAAFELQARLRNISEIVDKLMSLGELVRASGVGSRTMRAAKYEHVENGVNHTKLFENEYLPLVLKHRFKVEEPLLTRLSKAIALRRRRFLYQTKHQKRLAYGGGAQEEPLKAPRNIERKPTGKSTSMPVPRAFQAFTTGHRSGSVTEAPTKATTFRIADRPTTASRIMSASNKSMIRGVDFPPPPQPSSDRASHFECPYCCLLVPITKLEPKAWHQHVIADLQPFICLEPDCPNPNVLLESKTDWIEHQKWTHAMEWWCEGRDTEHAGLRFLSKDAFIEHQRRSHGLRMSTDVLQRRLISAGHPSLTPFNYCPFCDFLPEQLVNFHLDQLEDAVLPTITAQKSLQEHLHRELILIFLLALPDRDDLVDADNDRGTTCSPESRSTVDDVLDDFEPVVNDFSFSPDEEDDVAEDWQYVWTSSNTNHGVRWSAYDGHEIDEVMQNFQVTLLLERCRDPDFRKRPTYEQAKDAMIRLQSVTDKPSQVVYLDQKIQCHEDWMRKGRQWFGQANAPLHALFQHLEYVDEKNQACFDLNDTFRPPIESASREPTPDVDESAMDDMKAVFCICRQRAAGLVLKCEICKEWYHTKCLKIEGTISEESEFTCPICDPRIEIPRDTARPKLEDLQTWQDEILDLPFQPKEEEVLKRIVDRAQSFRDFLKQFTLVEQFVQTEEEISEMRFYLRKLEGAEVFLSYETFVLRKSSPQWQP